MDIVQKTYHHVFYEMADPRVKDWTLMSTPWTVASIIAGYLTTIKIILPWYMKDRTPVELKTVIKWYNIMQIAANSVVSWGIMTSGWTTTYTFGCQLPDYSMNPEALRMLRFLWWTVIVKMLEMLETVFFLLRKKEHQASFLHVYHHISSLILMWAGVKYVGGGITSFTPMVNNAVHIIMYTYYLLSSEGSPAVKSVLVKHKKWITTMQMVQFTVVLIHASQVYLPSCDAPLGVSCLYFPNVILVYYMFYDFFKKNYTYGSNGKYASNGTKNNLEKRLL